MLQPNLTQLSMSDLITHHHSQRLSHFGVSTTIGPLNFFMDPRDPRCFRIPMKQDQALDEAGIEDRLIEITLLGYGEPFAFTPEAMDVLQKGIGGIKHPFQVVELLDGGVEEEGRVTHLVPALLCEIAVEVQRQTVVFRDG